MSLTSTVGYAEMIAGLVVGSLGQGVAWGPIWIAVGSDMKDEEQGVASAMASTTFQIGGAVGLALLGSLLALLLRQPPRTERELTKVN